MGRLRDTYITSRAAFGRKRRLCGRLFRRGRCRGHALRWRSCLSPGCTVAELAALFERGETEGRAVFPLLMPVLGLDETTAYGFASLEEAGPEGLVRLYFRPGNVIHQGFLARLLHPGGPCRQAGSRNLPDAAERVLTGRPTNPPRRDPLVVFLNLRSKRDCHNACT